MIHDHWKALARLLGAPGATEPPAPKTKVKSSGPAKNSLAPEGLESAGGGVESEESAVPAAGRPVVAEDRGDLAVSAGDFAEDRASGLAMEEVSPLQEMVAGAQAAPSSSWDVLVEKLGIQTEQDSTGEDVPQQRERRETPRREGVRPASASSMAGEREERHRERQGPDARSAASQERAQGPSTLGEGQKSSVKKTTGFGAGLGDQFGMGDADEPPFARELTEPTIDVPETEELSEEASILGKKEASEGSDELTLDIDWGTPRRRAGRPQAGRSRDGRRQDKRPQGGEEQRDARGALAGSLKEPSVSEEAESPRRRGAMGGEDESTGPARRGRRRGQRQRMSEEGVEWETTESGAADVENRRSPQRRDAEDLGDFEETFGAGIGQGVDSAESMAVADESGEDDPTRRRRRRGRRRRGGARGGEIEGRDADEMLGSVDEDGLPMPSSTESAFDDDHEDDEEAVVLRRSRRRRRRGDGGDSKDRSATEESRQEFADIGDDEGEVSYQTQRNVPTWLEAVEILVVPNIESRKRDSRRGGTAGNGASGAGRSRGRK